jgi:hypothetical protein
VQYLVRTIQFLKQSVMPANGRFCCKSRSAPRLTCGLASRVEYWFRLASFEESHSGRRHHEKLHFRRCLSVSSSETQLGLLQHNRHHAESYCAAASSTAVCARADVPSAPMPCPSFRSVTLTCPRRLRRHEFIRLVGCGAVASPVCGLPPLTRRRKSPSRLGRHLTP